MHRALNLLRSSPHYRRESFDAGLAAAGYRLVPDLRDPRERDLLLIWNRYSGSDEVAAAFERAGATVLVVENCPLGNDLHGGSYSLARGQIALTGGRIEAGPADRWDSWGIRPQPWRVAGETVILGQRGIGNPSTRSPDRWAERAQKRYGGRIRPHPGTGPATPLADDLARAGEVITWSSAAALQALLLGIPVRYEHPAFVGGPACARPGEELRRDDAARLDVFRRLAWAIWTLEEIRSGEALRHAVGR